MSELPAGQVTIADLYRELVGIRGDVVRAMERVAVLDARNHDADTLHTDHEARIRILERFRYAVMGASVVVSGAAGTLGWLLGSGIHH